MLSHAVTGDGITIQTVAAAVWSAQKAAVPLALRVTNRHSETLRLNLFDTLALSLRSSAGREIPGRFQRDATGGGPVFSPPLAFGHTFDIDRPAQLVRGADRTLHLVVRDGFGGIWRFDGLHAGIYILQFHLHTTADQFVPPFAEAVKEAVWTGNLQTAPLRIRIQ